MILRGIFLTLLLSLAGNATGNPYAEFGSSSSILIVAELEAYSRSDRPLAIIDEDRISISNSCGYDTAILKIDSLISGEYELQEITVYLRLDEWCHGLFQDHVDSYLLALNWNGMVWEVDKDLSSRLIPDADENLWIVEWYLLEELEEFDVVEEEVIFDPDLLADITISSLINTGIGLDCTASREEQIEELYRYQPVYGDWPGNPLYFDKGISLDSFIEWLTANKPLKQLRPSASTGTRQGAPLS